MKRMSVKETWKSTIVNSNNQIKKKLSREITTTNFNLMILEMKKKKAV